MDGVLVIDKPSGPTSHDVVSKIRKVLKEKKVGHTGTLDPIATGVLPLVLGRATKVARYITGARKRYHAVVRLGVDTTTLDCEGEVLAEKPVNVTREQLVAALEQFRGEIQQMPPMYSAKKINGTPLYELARQGMEVDRAPKTVHIYSLELLGFNAPEVVLDVLCSSGTYVRALAKDLGDALGCGGHLHALRRTGAGCFGLEHAVTLDKISEAPELVHEYLIPVSRALGDLPRIDVPKHVARSITQGHQLSVAQLRTVDFPDFASNDLLGIGVEGGSLVAIAHALVASTQLGSCRRDEQALKTERVLCTVKDLN